MYNVGQTLKHNRSHNLATIVDVVNNRRGTLYTVQYETGDYRRYYQNRLTEIFKTVDAVAPTIDTTNVVFVDFKRRCVISFEEWQNRVAS